MLNALFHRLAQPLSIDRALSLLAHVSTHVLIVAPTTRASLAFAETLCRLRPCFITRGPITASVLWPVEGCLRPAPEIAQTFAGQSAILKTVVSFPDQIPCVASGAVMVPFLEDTYAFSPLEALLAMRHRPRVFALSASGSRLGFRLVEVTYDGAFDPEGRLISLASLVSLLLKVMGDDLLDPPCDWLASTHLAERSERVLWMQAREEMKDVECLLRMQLQSRFCDRERTSAALAAVVERQKILIGTALP
jgi:hypothetical protein